MGLTKILGLSASLRNARNKAGSKELVRDIVRLKDRKELDDYLIDQGNIRLEQYYQAGRNNDIPFDKLYNALRRLGGERGLSNSETCLAAALWGAVSENASIKHISLAEYFKADGTQEDIEELKELLIEADGTIIATPVYFGDRSSLSQKLIETIRRDEELKKHMEGKVYGGLAVGAKRNGGQETTLIYQIHDMMELGFLGVGNDYETTAQYGGTGHAGDIGTMATDKYGIGTCIGTGRRVSRIASFLVASKVNRLMDRLRIAIWILQEKDRQLLNLLKPFIKLLREKTVVSVHKIHETEIYPCMACDICPSRVGPDEEYRCIRGKSDSMIKLHRKLLDTDVIIPCMFSPKNRAGLVNVYQHFLERTRYLRRGDYALTDRLVIPLIISEIGSNENLNLRMTTSLIRHHTVLQKPIVGWIHDGKLINPEDIERGMTNCVKNGIKLLVGRLAMIGVGEKASQYKPIGYVLSLAKDNRPETISKREKAIQSRMQRLLKESKQRITLNKTDFPTYTQSEK